MRNLDRCDVAKVAGGIGFALHFPVNVTVEVAPNQSQQIYTLLMNYLTGAIDMQAFMTQINATFPNTIQYTPA